MYITDDIRYIGVNDHDVDLFEGQYTVPNGIAYNSYVILDEKIAVMDTVDQNFTHPWLDNLAAVLQGPSGYCSVLPSWDPSQGDFTASHSRWSAPGLTAVPSVCHRWNPGSSWGSRVSPQLWRPSADRELQLPLENDWVSCFNRISLFRGFLSGLNFFIC